MIGKQKESIFRYPTQFWSEERNLTWLLVALILDAFILYPLVSVLSNSLTIEIMNSLVFSVVLLFGWFALIRHKITQMVFGGIIVIIILVRVVRFVFGENWLLGWDILLMLVSVIAFLIVILSYVFKEGPVTGHRIRGAVAAYLLIAVAFALSYHLISFLIPGAFKFPDKALNIADPRFPDNFYYFSIETITTLGYGDIIPVHPFTRTLATMEAFVGQLYTAILLARLVGLHIVHRRGADK